MENRLLSSETVTEISKALLAAQRSMGNASKDSKNPFFKSSYADLNSVREVAIPALNTQDVSVLQPTVVYNGKSYVRTLLLHTSGQWMASDTEIVQSKPNDPQAHGSGISYARRYGLQSFLNIGAVDDDAEGAMGRTKTFNPKVGPVPEALKAVATPAKADAATTEEVKKPSSFRKPKASAATATAEVATKVEGWD